jgi:thiol-disulfide isomerase/thioredoxin
MKKQNFVYVIIVIFSISVIACQKKDADNKKIQVSTNQSENPKAPDFALQSVDGKTIKLSDYKGEIVIIDFWATWCEPCRMGIPDLVEIQNDYQGRVAVIGISLDMEGQTKQDVPDFVKAFKINYPILYCNEKVINDYGGVQSIPSTFIVDQKGNVIANFIGLTSKSDFVDRINELLKK